MASITEVVPTPFLFLTNIVRNWIILPLNQKIYINYLADSCSTIFDKLNSK